MFFVYVLIAALTLGASEAEAYIGPGVGAGAAAVVFGVIASVAIGFVAVLWYPFKRLLKRRKRRTPAESN